MTSTTCDWLAETWDALPERSRTIALHRVNGQTLEGIAQGLSLTRERVRQLYHRVEAHLVEAQEANDPQLCQSLGMFFEREGIVTEVRIEEVVPTSALTARSVLLGALGYGPPRVWGTPHGGLLAQDPNDFADRFVELASLAPLSSTETTRALSDLGLPDGVPAIQILSHPKSPLQLNDFGWVRRRHRARDSAFLWLRKEVEPRTGAQIAQAVGGSERALTARMHRDPSFTQLRPEGTWGLADWHLPAAVRNYQSASDVVVDVLRDMGPLGFQQLCAETQRRYPVSVWRVTQCLSSSLVGRHPDGQYDLVERGAEPVPEVEPHQPSNIRVHGTVVGIELEVDGELLRGSGILVSRWLTWFLGLRMSPTSRQFTLAGNLGVLTVRRNTSASQLSSLRSVALSLGFAEGCRFAVLMHTDDETATIRHTCDPLACAARTGRP
ncbi:MAG: hypothetical protein JW722_05275 [Demequinaceae bacterium]|nr:hypothetical protein [Demequinaceae bacterium]